MSFPSNLHRHAIFAAAGFAVLSAILAVAAADPAEKGDESMTEEAPQKHGRKPIPSADVLAGLPPDGGPDYNRLVFEKSPYLLQHAANPVDWRPWEDEAFEAARKEDKPVFLSIGYTTCHWCHVMEHESFEDEDVAALMNKYFICIKVDREERPDVDKIYMDITQAMTGAGGWPMTVVLTPDRKPFFAGTYFPKESRGNRPGMMDLLPQLGQAWKNERQKVLEVADRAAGALVNMNIGAPGDALDEQVLHTAFRQLASRYDAKNGGFSSAPKFPMPHNLSFLLRYWKRSGNAHALEMVEQTLLKMRLGGVYDHVGYGFHRYATDEVWLLPHFEKMLYDQALLAIAYLEAYQATGKDFYADTAREIFTYVLRDMTSPEGGFYSAQDADSEGEEGKFYTWSNEEVKSILGPEDGELYIQAYGLIEGGNFHDQATGARTGESIPHLKQSLPELAESLGMNLADLSARLEAARLNLFAVRENRIHPQKDDKILTDWNGLMIAAFSRGAQVLGEDIYRDAARKAADFVLATLRDQRGRLLKRYRQGEAGLPGHLEDYAFCVWGLIELYETNFDPNYLREAVALNDLMLAHFWDDERGGLYLTADDGEQLLVRGKEIYDGAIPSGNSVAMLNLVRLARLTGNTGYEERAAAVVKAFSGIVGPNPSGFTMLMQGQDFAVGPSYEVVLSGPPSDPAMQEMLKALRKPFLSNKVVLLREGGGDALAELAPYTDNMEPLEGHATAYVCKDFACKLPTSVIKTMLENLGVVLSDEDSPKVGTP